MPETSLTQFAATFDRSSLQPRLAEAEKQRQAIVDQFPREGLRTLEMARYVDDRENRSTLAWLLAKGTPALGDISGVAFNAIGIHKLKGSGLYRSTLTKTGDAAEDWVRLREGLARCCDLVSSRQWEAINQVPYASNIPSLRTKLLFVYFPDELLPMYVSTEVEHFLGALGISKSLTQGKWSVIHNRTLLEHLRALPELSGWSTMELAELLRAWFPKIKNKPSEMSQPELVLEAMQDMFADAPAENECVTPDQVRRYVEINFNRDIAACGTVMADMVAPGFTQTKTSKVPLNLRVLERVKPGLYRLLSDGDSTRPDSKDQETQTAIPMHIPALNQILYGPPGTGKTYRVIREAAAIIAGQPILNDQDAKAAYDRACAKYLVRLATFHQSFSYEDFIEGIRPVMDEGGEAKFQVRDGIFKEIATDALFACLERIPKASMGAPTLNEFEQKWQLMETSLDTENEMKIKALGTGQWTIELSDRGNLKGTKGTSSSHTSPQVLQKLFVEYHDKNEIDTADVKRVTMASNSNFSAAVFNHLKGLTVQETSPNKVAKEELAIGADQRIRAVATYLEAGSASGWRLREDKNYPPYVLIIDEINRGNISRIFGELITLIEDDKREGRENALRVTLPSSREPFTVPPNLFLLGTMNTADKSLALLDVALRRRFEFRELAPDFSVCGMPPEMLSVLERLNKRIELRKDRDHRIGHAFFMNVRDADSFNRAFAHKVVPLLQEYFFNDIDGARFVLGEIGREGEPGFLRQITAATSEAKYQRNRWRWFTDLEPGMNCWTRLQTTLGADFS